MSYVFLYIEDMFCFIWYMYKLCYLCFMYFIFSYYYNSHITYLIWSIILGVLSDYLSLLYIELCGINIGKRRFIYISLYGILLHIISFVFVYDV